MDNCENTMLGWLRLYIHHLDLLQPPTIRHLGPMTEKQVIEAKDKTSFPAPLEIATIIDALLVIEKIFLISKALNAARMIS